MIRRPARIAALLVAVLVMAGCQVSVTPPFSPTVTATVTAQDTTAPTALRSNVRIEAWDTLFFRVQAPVARDLLYGEVEVVGSGSLRVRMLDRNGRPLAASQSPAFFAGSLGALATLESEVLGADAGDGLLRPQIAVEFECLGPCVAVAPIAGDTLFLEVTNTGSQRRFFNLYAYTFAANDLNDRGSASNNTPALATQITGLGALSGAIELVGDVDWFRYTGSQSRVLEFTVLDSRLGLELRIVGGPSLTGLPGDRTDILIPGDVFVVSSVTGRAGPSGTSGYFLDVR